MNEIIEITDIRKAIPKKKIWYKYFDDIFISVVPEENIIPHIRRKAIIKDNKKDNKMSPWHLHWQYEIIEFYYGMNISGKKTYEIPIFVNGQTHIIDSVVQNIAIEFQHTLSVSLEEMNSRFFAHKSKGYIPYLILDFTAFWYDYAESINKSVFISQNLQNALNKWIKSAYYLNNNLFLDFGTRIVRFYNGKIFEKLNYEILTFTENLQKLEIHFTTFINHEKDKLIRELENVKKYEKEQNLIAKKENEDFKFFRICLQDPTIRNLIQDFENDNITYHNYGEWDENIYKKTHDYFSDDNPFRLSYTTYSEKNSTGFKYLFAEIYVIIGKGSNSKNHEFRKENGKIIPILDDKFEF